MFQELHTRLQEMTFNEVVNNLEQQLIRLVKQLLKLDMLKDNLKRIRANVNF